MSDNNNNNMACGSPAARDLWLRLQQWSPDRPGAAHPLEAPPNRKRLDGRLHRQAIDEYRRFAYLAMVAGHITRRTRWIRCGTPTCCTAPITGTTSAPRARPAAASPAQRRRAGGGGALQPALPAHLASYERVSARCRPGSVASAGAALRRALPADRLCAPPRTAPHRPARPPAPRLAARVRQWHWRRRWASRAARASWVRRCPAARAGHLPVRCIC